MNAKALCKNYAGNAQSSWQLPRVNAERNPSFPLSRESIFDVTALRPPLRLLRREDQPFRLASFPRLYVT